MIAHGKPDLARTIRLLLPLYFLSSFRGAAAQQPDSAALAEIADTLSWPCSNDDATQRDEIRKTYADSGNGILKLREELDYKRATAYAPILRYIYLTGFVAILMNLNKILEKVGGSL